jgi:hypothetical protein
MRIFILALCIAIAGTAAASDAASDALTDDLPVDASTLLQNDEVSAANIRNLITLEQLHRSITSGTSGLSVSFAHVTDLTDGTEIDPAMISGTAYFGPYPFEAKETDFPYRRFRDDASVDHGHATLKVGSFFESKYNSEGWTDCGTLAVRFDLHLETLGRDRALGRYDTFADFCRTEEGYEKLPTVVEGPLVNRVTSNDPTSAVIALVTDRPAAVAIAIAGQTVNSAAAIRHEIPVSKLPPGKALPYEVRVEGGAVRHGRLQTAPAPGQVPLRFAYTSDSREGVGGGMLEYMGVNHDTLERLAARAAESGAEFLIMGGDLVNGYTTSTADFQAQLYAWKQAMAGFWRSHPVYPAMGNHEALLRAFRIGKWSYGVVDRWPYDTDSAEAVFADAFANPTNGPALDDPRRPSYEENVYSFQYGAIKAIAFNNNYWRGEPSEVYGGAPEGWIFDDQLRWIEAELEAAEKDPSVRYVVLYAQEPVFPLGGHVDDAMWYHGDNRVRAHVFSNGKLHPEPIGIIDVRNRLVRAVASSSKVAAVLAGDEHAYCRVLIDNQVPIGDPARDDTDGNGVIDWRVDEAPGALEDLERPTWYVTCGGAGAPYYAEEPTPWAAHWRTERPQADGVFYSSQECVVLFDATEEGLAMTVLNPFGETIDRLENLMAVRASSRSTTP